MREKNFISNLHKSTRRDCLGRMNDDKVNCMIKARKFEKEFWDGNRRYGYGGYKYIPGRWKKVAEKLIKTYKTLGKIDFSVINFVGTCSSCLEQSEV